MQILISVISYIANCMFPRTRLFIFHISNCLIYSSFCLSRCTNGETSDANIQHTGCKIIPFFIIKKTEVIVSYIGGSLFQRSFRLVRQQKVFRPVTLPGRSQHTIIVTAISEE